MNIYCKEKGKGVRAENTYLKVCNMEEIVIIVKNLKLYELISIELIVPIMYKQSILQSILHNHFWHQHIIPLLIYLKYIILPI